MLPQVQPDAAGTLGVARSPLPFSAPGSRPARWSAGLAELGPRLAADPADPTARGAAWQILQNALRTYLNLQMARCGSVCADDACDIAAEKSLEILRSIESGKWAPHEWAEADIRGYIAKVARNGLLDRLRRLGRQVSLDAADETRLGGCDLPAAGAEAADGVHRREFVEAAVRCVRRLTPRARRVWMLRVFAELPTKTIATHPGIACKPGHVDVILQRSREKLRACLAGLGFDRRHLVPGTFAALWRTLHLGEGAE